MPRKRFNKKKRFVKKRNTRNTRKRNYSKALITHVKGQGISDMMYVKLKYVEQIKISGGVAPYFQYIFRGNSLFDPNLTGTGHQPMYFDQYAALYSRYRVIGSAIQLDVVNISGDSALFYVCEPNTDQSTIVDISTLYEQARSGAPKIIPIAQRITSRMKKYASTKKVCGLTRTQLFDDTFAASTVSNPSNTWFWNILFASVDGVTVPAGQLIVKITYYCQFFDRLLAIQS